MYYRIQTVLGMGMGMNVTARRTQRAPRPRAACAGRAAGSPRGAASAMCYVVSIL